MVALVDIVVHIARYMEVNLFVFYPYYEKNLLSDDAVTLTFPRVVCPKTFWERLSLKRSNEIYTTF